ncbi:MAG: PadR family transcriptional regulator, partial [Gemmatimonadetes bacterium]|nr:PadR family transcriptional regulator [Gemmatimonadota bacterium]
TSDGRGRTHRAAGGDEDPGDDQRRQYYRLTPTGRAALQDEVGRLQGILDQARATRGPRWHMIDSA